jgi:hypothetical protein
MAVSYNPRSHIPTIVAALNLLVCAYLAVRHPVRYLARRFHVPRHAAPEATVLPDALIPDSEYAEIKARYRTVADILTGELPQVDAGLSILTPSAGYLGGGEPVPLDNEPAPAAGHFAEFPVGTDRALAVAAA